MKLKEVQVRTYRNIVDSTPVAIDEDVTCLVGKNESGKTAFLEALCWLNPARSEIEASAREHYPAWLEKEHRQERTLDDVNLVSAVFELEGNEVTQLEDQFGTGILNSDEITIRRSYDGSRAWQIDVNSTVAVDTVLQEIDIPDDDLEPTRSLESLEELDEYISDLQADAEGTSEVAEALTSARSDIFGDQSVADAVVDALADHLPKFFYFGEYSTLPDSVEIANLFNTNTQNLDEGQKTARSLLEMAAADQEFLLNADYNARKRELENVANILTGRVLDYWSQNPDLRVEIDITKKTKSASRGGQSTVVDEMKVRIWDDRHSLSLPFREKSTGFQWFFSFLAAFSEFERTDDEVIILLDEPALGLHARAQGDFLTFIEDRLATDNQVVYTTHSPFMIQPGHLDRVRLVEDRGQAQGAVILEDVLSIDPDTLFPLQGALGYDMAQNLFIAPNNLVVEGTSDFTYLSVMSEYMEANDGPSLDEKWSVVPVGGADLIPTFVALLGQHLDVTILVDGQRADHQRLGQLSNRGYLEDKRILPVAEVLGRRDADIEDVFVPEDYLMIYNRAFSEDVELGDLEGDDGIVKQLERHLDIERFDHGRPADELLRHRDEILPELSEETFERFGALFEAINETLAS